MKKALSLFLSLCMIFSMFAVSGTSYASDKNLVMAGIGEYRVSSVKMSPMQTLTIDVYAVSSDVDITVSNTKSVNNCNWVVGSEWTQLSNGTYYRPMLVYANAVGTSNISLKLKDIDGNVQDTEVVTVSVINASISIKSAYTMDSAKARTLTVKPVFNGGLGDGLILEAITQNRNIVNLASGAVKSDGSVVLTATGHGKVTITLQYRDAGTNMIIAKKSFTVDVHRGAKVTQKATTSKNGYIATKCSICNKTLSTQATIYYPKTISLSTTSYTYDGKAKKPSITVKDSKGKKIASSNYTVSYSSGRKSVGKYTVTIKFKGNYSGTVKKTFTIKPKSTTLSKVSAGKKAFTVKWKKQTSQTTGYQIQYSTASNFKGAKTVTVSSNKTTSKKISKLKAKKKYYVRVRTYKTVKINGKNTKIYSSWSKAKTVKTK